MATACVEYLGDLRTKCTHLASQEVIYTDAPKDNNGKGEAFSPTDLVASAYASCVITTIGIYCMKKEMKLLHAKAHVTKVMTTSPRKIGQLIVELDLSNNQWTEHEQEKIKHVAKACPVAKSLQEDIEIALDIVF